MFMVKSTFLNLPAEKQARITQALLHEFSRVPLATAQVAPIIKQAQIARGAFYKYFTDLTDAYQYLYQLALADIHQDLNFSKALTAKDYIQLITNFLSGTKNSPYYDFIRLSVTQNDYFLRLHSPMKQLASKDWAVATLCHEAIFACFFEPEHQGLYLARLEEALTTFLKGV